MKKILMLAFATMMTFVAGAQDFGQDKVVNAPTTWTFEQYAGNSVNKLEELNGLYLRASEKHDFKCAASHIKVTLADGGDAPVFAPAAAGTIAAGKAYYSTRADKDTYASSGASATAKGISLPLDVTPTGINSVVAEGTNVKNQNAYNIAGQRIGKDYKGLVIINGKKYIRK